MTSPYANPASDQDLPLTTNDLEPRRGLTLWDAASIVVGTIIGSAIFRLPPIVAMQVDSIAWFVAAWVLGGLIAFCGALCFAELTTAYNEDGGDYVYLRQAFGRYVAFQFAWTAGWIIRPANVAAMAVTFAKFAEQAIPAFAAPTVNSIPYFQILLAMFAVVILGAFNLKGIQFGRWTQNLLTACKVTGLFILITIGFWPMIQPIDIAPQDPSPPSRSAPTSAQAPVAQKLVTLTLASETLASETLASETLASQEGVSPIVAAESSQDIVATEQADHSTVVVATPEKSIWSRLSGLMMALVFVLFTFGGWNDVSFIAAEIKEPQRNLPKALLLGLSLVTVIYLLVNWALISNLGLEGLAASDNSPADVVSGRMNAWGWGDWVTGFLGLLVSVSCLGAVNAMLITSPRIYYAAGKDNSAMAWFARWNHQAETPIRALIAQTLATILMLIVCGGLSTTGSDPFEELVSVSSPFFWLFLALVGIGLIVLRFTDAQRPRPILAFGYPLTPTVFILASMFMFYSSLSYSISQQYWISGSIVLIVFAIGLVVGLQKSGPSSES